MPSAREAIEKERQTMTRPDPRQPDATAGLRHAENTRKNLNELGILLVNILGAPGSGKTSLIERTIDGLDMRCAVVAADPAGSLDAERIRARGVPCVQLHAENGALDAETVAKALETLPLGQIDIVFAENVGGLIAPAEIDLGEDYRVVVTALAQGSDIPAKYPKIFTGAAAVLLTQIDLKPYTDFDEIAFWDDVTRLAPRARRLRVSNTGGEGLEFWIKTLYAWADARVKAKKEP